MAFSFPLIEFTPGRELPALSGQLAALSTGDLLFALSQHAVEFAHARLHQLGQRWPKAPGYFAIGRTTALALHTVSGPEYSLPIRSGEISEVLLQLPGITKTLPGRSPFFFAVTAGRNY